MRKTPTGLPDWTSRVSSFPSSLELAHDGVEALPVARGLADAAVDDEVLRALGHLGVEVVHQHAQGRFLLPALHESVVPRGARTTRAGGAVVVDRASPRSHRYSQRTARRFGRAGDGTRADEDGERLDLGGERAVLGRARRRATRTSAWTASSGADERVGAMELDRLAGREQLDGEDARGVLRRRAPPSSAAVGPIETWSSLPAEVGIESTLAGWASALFSETSAAAVTCAIIKPECSPPSRARKAGRPRERRVHEPLDAPLADARELGGRDRQQVGRERHRLAVEVAAREDLARLAAKTSGLSVAAFISTSSTART